MTARVRFAAACLIVMLAVLAATLASLTTRGVNMSSRDQTWRVLDLEDTDSLDAEVLNIVEGGVFAQADIIRSAATNDSNTELGIDDIENALTRPRLSALVFRDGHPALYLFDRDGSVIDRRQVGDVLSGGWTISQITPTSVTLVNGNEIREIRAFSGEADDADYR